MHHQELANISYISLINLKHIQSLVHVMLNNFSVLNRLVCFRRELGLYSLIWRILSRFKKLVWGLLGSWRVRGRGWMFWFRMREFRWDVCLRIIVLRIIFLCRMLMFMGHLDISSVVLIIWSKIKTDISSVLQAYQESYQPATDHHTQPQKVHSSELWTASALNSTLPI